MLRLHTGVCVLYAPCILCGKVHMFCVHTAALWGRFFYTYIRIFMHTYKETHKSLAQAQALQERILVYTHTYIHEYIHRDSQVVGAGTGAAGADPFLNSTQDA
jgi:hypothetical protein